MTNDHLRVALQAIILEIQLAASPVGHDLGPFEPVDTLTGGHEEEHAQRSYSGKAWTCNGDVRGVRSL